ncbi:hypothetical protein LPMP_041140 [Leishmania panamensis]|uniref:Uncharacterized protein n=1 Tax=Leishmania panamensis TaxID=5679 RepID=A0A088S1R7_LEIPA|nr:hypothetical protein LPMP_041140 [Leishmania panamensis]AIN95436.1 hypothetical protein LPMP_041140 [Leishmania panamensis]
MSEIRLSSYSAVCWRPGKAGFVDVVGPISRTEVPQQTSSGSGTVVSAPIALECVRQPEQDLIVWLGWKGCRDFKKGGKGLHKVLYVCTTVTHSGVFFTYHKGERLGFALITHDSNDPQKLGSRPTLYKEELSGLMADVLHDGEGKKTSKQLKQRQLVTVRQAVIRETLEGHVLAAVFINRRGDVYALVAHLTKNAWRKWRMDAAIGFMPCIHVSDGGRDVRLVHCDIGEPIDHTSTTVAPSLPLALLTFDRVSMSSVIWAAQVAAAAPPLLCVRFREFILPTRGSEVAAERVFQSQCVECVLDNARKVQQPCLAQVDEATAVYTVVVSWEQSSYLLHMRHSLCGSGLMTNCTMVAGLHRPISACTLSIPSLHRPRGARVSLVLCDDMRVYCCEHFGHVASVSLNIEGVDCSVLTLPAPPAGKSTRKVWTATILPARLIPLHNQTEVLCTNGTVGLFLRVSYASFSETVPVPPGVAVEGTIETAGYGTATEVGVGAAALRLCLESLQRLSVRTARHDLPDVVFRHIMPHLRYVGTSQQEVMLMQRLYEQLLQMAKPILESEWTYLWSLTSLLQKALVKRGRDNQLRYTDTFFLQLADAYRQSSFASPSGETLVGDGVRSVVSVEAQGVIAAPTATLPAEVGYVLDGLAAGVAPVALAEEIVRRMVRTETLLNDICVVSSQDGVASCVHCMGCVLVASCLDLSVFAIADEAGGLRVSLQRPQDGVCVAVQPYTFANQEEFETALSLAGDLLCVYSADESFRPDVALLTLSIGRRQHCLTTFLQLFAPVLRQAVDAVMPLSSNRDWFEKCVATLAQPSTEWAVSLLRKGSSDSFTITAALCHVLCTAHNGVDAVFFRSLSGTLSVEFCATALVARIFHQTERLLAATQNYASALTTYISTHKSEAEQDTHAQAMDVGRKRLHTVLAQTSALWAQMDSLSPYPVRDVAESYRISVGISLAPVASTASALTEGTMVSRTLVLCFRIFCLVQYSLEVEKDASLAVSAESASWTADDAIVRDCQGALEALYLLVDSPFPLEWLQWKFMSHVRYAATIRPTWVPFLVRLMQLSNVRQSSSANLKRDFYTLLGALQIHDVSSTTKVAEGDIQRAIAAAESTVGAVAIQAGHCGPAAGTEGDRPAQSTPTVFFIFSHQRDPSLPSWTDSHSLPERRHLFATNWADALWTLERVPGALQKACAAALARVQLAASEESTTSRDRPHLPALSEELALSLYAHLYRLSPPVRIHAIADAAPADGDGARGDVQQSEARVQEYEEASREPTATPEKLAASPQQEQAPVTVLPSANMTTPGPLLSLSVEPEAAVRTGTSEPTPKEQPSSKASASADASADAELAASTRTGLYSPASVAWWDTLETTPNPQRSFGVKAECATATATSPVTADDNGESSDTATTYTTSTSYYADPVAMLRSYHPRCYTRGDRHMAVDSVGSSCSSLESHCCRRRYAAASSPAQYGARKKCRCCSRPLRVDSRGRSVGRRGEVADEATPIRVQWRETAEETTPTHVQRPPVAAKSPVAAAARPADLAFSTALQPPKEPSRVASPMPLLTFSLAPNRKEASRVRLYVLDGDRARLADEQETVLLSTASRPVAAPTTGTLLEVPPLPATSVFVAPQPLLRLPPQPAAAQLERRAIRASDAAEAAQPVRFVQMERPYPQAPRAPAGVAPPAVDIATLQTPATNAPVPVRPADEIASASACAAAPVAAPYVPPAPAILTPRPVPTVSPVGDPSVLSPAQMCEFRRYIDDLLARQRGTAPLHVATTASALTAAPPTPESATAAPAATNFFRTAEIERLLEQQDSFIRKSEAILEALHAENDGFHQRVMENIRSLTTVSQQLRGLSPVEQAQLVQDTVKQRNELLTLNHQLLELQLAAARVSGEVPPVPTTASGSSQAAPQRVTSTSATQTQAQLRESVGVSWATTDGFTASTTAAAATVPSPIKWAPGREGMRETLSDLHRLNAELMAVGTSAEAMEKAIKETREVIQRYERYKMAEALTAEGVALTSAMRQRTAAIERRLAELPKTVERTAAPGEKRSSSVWIPQRSVAETVGDPLAGVQPAAWRPAFISSAGGAPSPSSHLPAQAETSAVVTGDALLSRNVVQYLPLCNPLGAMSPSTSVPQMAKGPQPEQQASPTVAVCTAPVASIAKPPDFAVFTSVSSTPIDEVMMPRSATQEAPQPNVSLHAEWTTGGEVPSLHVRETMKPTNLDLPRAVSHDITAPRVTAQLCDPSSSLVEDGCRYEALCNSSTAPLHRRVEALPLRSLLGCSQALKPHTVERRCSPNSHLWTRPHHMCEERYAMYRATSRSAKVRPAAAARSNMPGHRCVLTGDAFVDRQQRRRLASIAKRMEQLEEDLFA